MKTADKKRRFLTGLLLFTLVFIFGNSLLPPKISRKISASVTQALGGEPTVETEEDDAEEEEKEKKKGMEYYVRKGGHLAEYFLLGTELTLLLFLQKKDKRDTHRVQFFAAMTVPLIDETIQVFSSRGPLVTDIWIDIAGFAIGCLGIHGFRRIGRRIGQQKKKET